MRHAHRQRGFSLILVLGMMALAGGVVVVLTYQAGQMQREYQWDRLDSDLRRVVDSAEAFARSHAVAWRASPPASEVTLDVGKLVDGGVRCEASIAVEKAETAMICHIRVHVQRARHKRTERFSIELD